MRSAAECLTAALVAALVLSGCTGGGKDGTPKASASPAASPQTVNALPTCKPAPMTAYAWPKPVPADLPKLPGVRLGVTKQTKEGLTIVRFTTSTSLRDAIVHIVKTLPPAGYALGRGDAEAAEADAPFSKGDLRGVLRGISSTACTTEWLLAVTRTRLGGTGSPLLPVRPGVSPSPLPFGTG